jgi:hypothetical protein
MDKIGGWLSFNLASEEVERRLGVTWGAAQKTVVDWCESGALRWENVPMGGPKVSYNDLQRCLRPKSMTLVRKQPKRNSAEDAIKQIWPDGIPSGVVNADIEKKVGAWLKERDLSDVSRDTILRAAGRKA